MTQLSLVLLFEKYLVNGTVIVVCGQMPVELADHAFQQVGPQASIPFSHGADREARAVIPVFQAKTIRAGLQVNVNF
jgi:hypothetical protein